jgi:hypothetical protein
VSVLLILGLCALVILVSGSSYLNKRRGK